MAVIGVVADDFTGTASAGVLVARSQIKTGLFFDTAAVKRFEGADQLDAIYVSSNSRHLKAEEAYSKVAEATNTLKNMGIKYFSKKIDTTLRGGIGFEVDAMLDTLGNEMIAVMVTAMPQSHRICVGGYSVIDGIILTETPVSKDVKTPVNESYVLDLVRKQTKRNVDLITLKDVLSGKNELKKRMVESVERGNRILIVDAITLEHIDSIAKACIELNWNILAVDPGAFTMKLLYHRRIAQEERPNIPKNKIKTGGKTVLGFVGSANPATKVQIEKLCGIDCKNKLLSVSPFALIKGGSSGKSEVERVISEIEMLLSGKEKPRAIIVETAMHTVIDLHEEDKKHGYVKGTASKLLNEGLAKIAEEVLERVGKDRIAGLFLSGGDTMECICREIGVICIRAIDNIVSQIDVGRIIGKYNGMPLVAKGGFCGDENIGMEIVNRLFLESERENISS